MFIFIIPVAAHICPQYIGYVLCHARFLRYAEFHFRFFWFSDVLGVATHDDIPRGPEIENTIFVPVFFYFYFSDSSKKASIAVVVVL